MAAKRTKTIVTQGVTQEQMEQAFAEFATADARSQQITSKMDVEITRIREKYQDDLLKLSEVKERNFDIMQTFAVENRADLFSKRKSIETVHGVLGFRTGTPKLKTLKGFTWPSVTNLLKEFLPAYVRTVEEPAKDRLLADRDNEDVADLFAKVGIKVDQDETFFVEPKKEEVTA
jgi:phage host-nuclease inhibitor protein Gam